MPNFQKSILENATHPPDYVQGELPGIVSRGIDVVSAQFVRCPRSSQWVLRREIYTWSIEAGGAGRSERRSSIVRMVWTSESR